jgi:chemotaxis response regulator CheB
MNTFGRDIIVLGGSAGAMEATQRLLKDLPSTLPASVFVALHRGLIPGFEDTFASRLRISTPLITDLAEDGLPFRAGHAYLAPFDHHLLLENGVMRLEQSPREMHSRPCIDVLFKSAAAAYGRRVIGVLLSGSSVDGSAGLWLIKKRGGIAVIQDPAEAQFRFMPENAIASITPDFVLPLSRIATTLMELARPARMASDSPKILIVEDESVVATNLKRQLAKLNYDVIDWVPTGEAAIELAERTHPDLVLMDIHLAGKMSGVDAARQIWERLQIPIVYCTAHSDVETLQVVETTENYGFIVKPLQSAAVRAAIQLALARRAKEVR